MIDCNVGKNPQTGARIMLRLIQIAASCVLMLAAAIPAAAQSGSMAGFWTGTYRYDAQPQGSLQQFTKFTMCIVQEEQEFKGFIRESNTFGNESALWLTSTITGTSDDGTFQFTKTYDGNGGQSHSVLYKGTLGANGTGGVTGTGAWKIGETENGSFSISKIPQSEMHPLAGVWTANYEYPQNSGQPPVSGHVVIWGNLGGFAGWFREEKSFGEGTDPWLWSDFSGSFEVTSRMAYFTKTYDGTAQQFHVVDYDGAVLADDSALVGAWKLGNLLGNFEMKRSRLSDWNP